jgi:hypothetical protein
MRSERGSAMIIAVLVIVILTLLGVSFLLMAETENRISENERLGQQALYFGESGVRVIKRWFDFPASAENLINPPLNVIDRTLRYIDDDGNPGTAPVAANGVANGPLCYFKQGWDLDADGLDDVFEKPYREGPKFALMGTEDHPDMRITEDASSAARTFLGNLSNALLANFPTQNYRARIRSIDFYEPPYVYNGSAWVRYGIGTVKVIARIYRTLGDGTEQVLSERMIKAVLNETPYFGPMGPLHSCSEVLMTGDFGVHWGLTSSVGNMTLSNNFQKVWASVARERSPNPRIDHLWGFNDYLASGTKFQSYVTAMTGRDVRDPWARTLTATGFTVNYGGTPGADAYEPYKYPWTVGTPLGDDPYEAGLHVGATPGALSHLQAQQPVSCIEMPYDVWKAVATSGEGDVRYFTWSSGTSFKENGFGTAQPFEDLTDDQTGLFFFDTKDGVAPYTATGSAHAQQWRSLRQPDPEDRHQRRNLGGARLRLHECVELPDQGRHRPGRRLSGPGGTLPRPEQQHGARGDRALDRSHLPDHPEVRGQAHAVHGRGVQRHLRRAGARRLERRRGLGHPLQQWQVRCDGERSDLWQHPHP